VKKHFLQACKPVIVDLEKTDRETETNNEEKDPPGRLIQRAANEQPFQTRYHRQAVSIDQSVNGPRSFLKNAEFPTIIQSSWNQAITLQACSFLLPIL